MKDGAYKSGYKLGSLIGKIAFYFKKKKLRYLIWYNTDASYEEIDTKIMELLTYFPLPEYKEMCIGLFAQNCVINNDIHESFETTVKEMNKFIFGD